VKEVVMEGAQETVDVLREYEEINASFMDEEILNDPDKMDKLIARQGEVQDRIDALDAWELDTKLERAMAIDDRIMRFLCLKYDAKMLRHRELQKKGEVPSIFKKEEDEVVIDDTDT
jgi:hypothetical protein